MVLSLMPRKAEKVACTARWSQRIRDRERSVVGSEPPATVDEDSEGLEEVEGDIEKVDGVVVAEQAIGE